MEVDYCITTMNRPQALERLLLSIAAHRPQASIHIADQSERFDPARYGELAERLQEAGLHKPPTVHRLPFDCGVSVARNFLMDETPGRYKLGLDDDFLFTDRTDVDAMVQLLDAHPEAGIVGGAVTRKGRVRHFGTRIERRGSCLRQLQCDEPFHECNGVRFKQIDFVPLFVLTRKKLYEHVRWDPELKVAGAHFDFMLRVLTSPFTVLCTPDILIDHPPTEVDEAYLKLRRRGKYVKMMMEKHGITHLQAISGKVFEA